MQFATFAEQGHFTYPTAKTYSGVIINANMVAHAPGGIAGFLLEKKHPNVSHIVDPLTHAFQHDPGYISNASGEPKSSLQKLASAYGSPINEILGKRPILPKDFKDPNVLKQFTANVLDFQNTHLSTYIQESGASKYLDDDENKLPPYALVAPYFYLTETTLDSWLPIMTSCAETASAIVADLPSKFFVAVVISKGLLVDQDQRQRLVAACEKLDCDGYLLWIDDFDETLATRSELRSFLNLAKELRGKKRREVIDTHGGYFSVLATSDAGKFSLTGTTHGPEFGEFRSVIPVGGGIPIAKFYIPDLHSRERYRDAVQIFQKSGWLESAETFHSNVCNCPACQETIAGNPDNFGLYGDGTIRTVKRKNGMVRIAYPTTETKIRCLQHYLQCKMREFTTAEKSTSVVLLGNLETSIEKYQEILGLDGIAHLTKWLEVLSEDR